MYIYEVKQSQRPMLVAIETIDWKPLLLILQVFETKYQRFQFD